MEIRGNEELFNKWRSLGNRIIDLCGIVQNDMDIPIEQIGEWVMLARSLGVEYDRLVKDTMHHLGANLAQEKADFESELEKRSFIW